MIVQQVRPPKKERGSRMRTIENNAGTSLRPAGRFRPMFPARSRDIIWRSWPSCMCGSPPPRQVLEHHESTDLQYKLANRAVALGWPQDRVLVIDDDLGQSGTTAENRVGFQRLLAEIGLSHVGLVLGMEMSRLARCNRDWHQLLELCAVFGSLLADLDGLYDPGHYNDRLLLGLKGTMSEAELHLLKTRMMEGKRNKAERGELFGRQPTGYVRQPSGEVILDPDEQVQSVLRLIFEKFEELGNWDGKCFGTCARTESAFPSGPLTAQPWTSWSGESQLLLRCTASCGIPSMPEPTFTVALPLIPAARFPVGRAPARREFPWSSGRSFAVMPCRLTLPGTSTWRTKSVSSKTPRNLRRWGSSRRTVSAGRAGDVCALRLANVCRIPRQSGKSDLLSAAMMIRWSATVVGQNVSASVVDELVARQVLQVLEPASVELALQAEAKIQREQERLEKHWQQELERAQYKTERARRQYDAVEPENRLVARELERHWEQAIAGPAQGPGGIRTFPADAPQGSVSRGSSADPGALLGHSGTLEVAFDLPLPTAKKSFGSWSKKSWSMPTEARKSSM